MEQRTDVFARMQTFEYQWMRAEDRAHRITGAIAQGQLAEAVLLPDGRRRSQRVKFWANQMREIDAAS